MNQHTVPNATMGLPGKPPNGGSNPRFYEFDDGVTRLVKWHPSRHGAKACYNELVASRLGQLLGAPILRGGIVFVSDDIIPPDHKNEGATAGFHFGVTRMEGENFVPAHHYTEIENSSALPLAAVFLAWVAVGDQEGHNQFLQRLERRHEGSAAKATKHFRLVDMGQMFGNFNWCAANVAQVHARYKLPAHLADKLTWDKLRPAIKALEALNEADLRACCDGYPEEWGISTSDRDACVSRILGPLKRIEEIIKAGNSSIK